MRMPCTLLAIAGCFAILLGLFPSAAQAATCSSVCTTTSSCDLSCTAFGGGEPEITTCGNWGRCAYPPPPTSCTSNWVTTSSTPVGGFSRQSFAPPGCDYYGVYRITQHDTNNCKPDRVYCQSTFIAFRSDYACCTYYWCGGTISC